MGLILAGKDRLACDVVGSYLLGHDGAKVPHIAEYARLEGRSTQLSDVEVVGVNPDDYRVKLDYKADWANDLMASLKVSGIHLPAYGEEVCSACGFNLWAGLFQFCLAQKGGHFDNVQLCMGNRIEPSNEARTNVLIGKCAIEKFKDADGVLKIPGCPPDPAKMAQKLTRELCGQDKV